jgi:histidinol dehydrogenase
MIRLLTGAEAKTWLAQPAPPTTTADLGVAVSAIIERVRRGGDVALAELASSYGDSAPRLISVEERRELAGGLSPDLYGVLRRAADNIEAFALAVMGGVQPVAIETPELRAGMDLRPVSRVACYAPGGRHPLPSTVLMTGMAARAAGVPSIDVVCPSSHPAILAAAEMVGARKVYQMGGAQAVAALAYGTDTVDRVDMVVGPGNAFVTEAKRQLQGVIGIDMLAGPSEVAIVADEGADPRWLALDLLAQAEHDLDARVVLLTWVSALASRVRDEITAALGAGGYPDFLTRSLESSVLLVLEDKLACLQACDLLAPEHLHLALADAGDCKEKLSHYGGLFLGYGTTVPFGDYVAGPNHTLPTGRTARFSGGLSPLTFLRPQCWLQTVGDLHRIASDTAVFADMEGLSGHAAAARARL